MSLNEFIKPESKDIFSSKYIENDKFFILGGGNFGRKLLRSIAKRQLQKNKGTLESPLGKMRSRQERKAMAKSLGVPFTPRYNGAIYRKETKLVEVSRDDRTTTYMHTVSEVK